MLYHITRLGQFIHSKVQNITLQGVQDFFFPKFVWQFGLLIFDFSKRLDGCAMTWICQPALPCHQFALRVSLVEELLPLLSCTHPFHQRLQCVLEKMFCKEG